jgi:hypothetical protein
VSVCGVTDGKVAETLRATLAGARVELDYVLAVQMQQEKESSVLRHLRAVGEARDGSMSPLAFEDETFSSFETGVAAVLALPSYGALQI